MKKTLIMAPFSTESGYGHHSRDIIKCILNMDEYDITLVPMNWGNNPMNALNADNPYHRKMMENIQTEPLRQQPDLFIHITIPNEFKQNPIGKKNIGITAGIEVDRVSPEWIKKANQMDAVIVPSKHSKKVFEESKYQVQRGGQQIGTIQLETEIEKLFEGVDKVQYKSVETDYIEDEKRHPLSFVSNINEEFNFLHVGQWEQKDFRKARKDTDGLLYNFYKTFKGYKDEVGLILKVNGAGFSYMDRDRILDRIDSIKNKFDNKEDLPNVYLVYGNLTNDEINELYNLNKVKAMVSTTHGEGYSRTFSEFLASTKKPVLATGWSGHLEFMENYDKLLFDYEMEDVPKESQWEDVIIEDSQWAKVIDEDVQNKMLDCYKNYNEYKEQSNQLGIRLREQYSLRDMKDELSKILDKHGPATESNLVMPDNLDTSKLNKIE